MTTTNCKYLDLTLHNNMITCAEIVNKLFLIKFISEDGILDKFHVAIFNIIYM
jgi:hypothetical protein